MSLMRLYDTGRVQRFHAEADYSGAPRQNLAEHCWGVALIVREIYLYKLGPLPAHVLTAALLHDAEESVLGDLPAPVKWRYPDLDRAYKAAESQVRVDLGLRHLYEKLTEEERWIVKWADSLELLLYSKKRLEHGSPSYEVPMRNIMEAISKYPQIPECVAVLDQITRRD